MWWPTRLRVRTAEMLKESRIRRRRSNVRAGKVVAVRMPTRAADDTERAERMERIEMILEELRLNTEDLHELARQAKVRAVDTRRGARLFIEDAQRKTRKKR